MTNVQDFLEEHLRGEPAPFLFAGAGLSRRYANADSWKGLLQRFAEMTPHPYEYFSSSAGEDMPKVASEIADYFHELWWNDQRFAESRNQYRESTRNRESAFKIEVSRYLKRVTEDLASTGPFADELQMLSKIVCDGIITTNFDTILETIFPNFKSFIGQDQMLFTSLQGVGEIYKIHGCCSDPNSLVLTASDYERFDQRNPYLAAKLLTIFVEHPVIFIGYSLNDSNVTSILRSIAGCLTQENIHQLQDRLIFVQWKQDAEPSFEPSTLIVGDIVIPVQRIIVPDYLQVFSALASFRRSFSVDLLRSLKEHVYELVLTGDPNGQIFVADIDDETPTADFDVVFGVGMARQLGRQGYVGLQRWDLINDVIDDGNQLDAEAVVTTALPSILQSSGNVPLFKYLHLAGMLDPGGQIKDSVSVPPSVALRAEKNRGGIPSDTASRKKAPETLQGISGILDLEQKLGSKGVLRYGTLLDPQQVDTSELSTFITSHRHDQLGSWDKTQYIKLVCFLDWLKYGT